MTDRPNGGAGASGKKPYSKPAVRQIPLRPEEAVLGYCKTASGFGPTGTCAVTCSTAGS
jgi:hypothetical protein